MYLTHFGLTGFPFERDLQPDELFASTSLREAQARLAHLIELRGIGLITGEVGSGKTTACRQLLSLAPMVPFESRLNGATEIAA
jgi:type II secretory pathway predicted ATPase ExeA